MHPAKNDAICCLAAFSSLRFAFWAQLIKRQIFHDPSLRPGAEPNCALLEKSRYLPLNILESVYYLHNTRHFLPYSL
jgi:hypothetical protein